MRFVAPILQFLKRHYEKIILCLVLLGLAGAATWMSSKLHETRNTPNPAPETPHSTKPPAPIDLTKDIEALNQVTNPPPVVLSGDHNVFNPVTWKRKYNGQLIKILRTGPDALSITSLTPLYTVIAYDHPTGTPGIYVFDVQTNSGRRMIEHPKIDEKTRSGLYIVHGIKGASVDPTDLELILTKTQEHVWITKDKPYKQVDGYTADLYYAPDSHSMSKLRVGDEVALDGQDYKIVEITGDAVRVQNIKNTKITTVQKK